jgi:hypothetical protein
MNTKGWEIIGWNDEDGEGNEIHVVFTGYRAGEEKEKALGNGFLYSVKKDSVSPIQYIQSFCKFLELQECSNDKDVLKKALDAYERGH